MSFQSLTKYLSVSAIAFIVLAPSNAQGGPFLDWLFGRNRRQAAYPVGSPVPIGNGGYAAGFGAYGPAAGVGAGAMATGTAGYAGSNNGYASNYGTYYGPQLPVIGPAGAGYTARQPIGIAATVAPPTLSTVPNFRSSLYRAPVTYYRPILTTDPNTGAQVVAMAPCTSYQYQTQRTPAFGRSALFGSGQLPPVVPPARALPTYTLPSGGIPLGSASPSTIAPNATQNPGYAALYPQSVGGTMSGAYPTTPLGNTPYYGSRSGGCVGSFTAPNTYATPTTPPGLIAPPGSSTLITPAPTYGSPTTPPGFAPAMPGANTGPDPGSIVPGLVQPPSMVPSNPSGGATSSDPRANQPPALPNNFPTGSSGYSEGSRLRSIVRQPMTEVPSVPSAKPDSEKRLQVPLLAPIPIPEGFDRERSWNPGLLSEQDLTAQSTSSRVKSTISPPQSTNSPELARFAGQGKVIQWASFEEPVIQSKEPSNRLREITPAFSTKPLVPPPTQRGVLPSADRYDNSGWKTAR